MSEKSARSPELPSGQQAIHDLCGELLGASGNHSVIHGATVIEKAVAWSHMEPSQVQERLRAGRLGDLMLRDGETLSIDNATPGGAADAEERLRARWLGDRDLMREIEESSPEENANRMSMPDLGLFVGQASLTRAGVKARRLRIQGSADWTDEIYVVIGYEKNRYKAYQTVLAKTCSYWTKEPPIFVERNVSSPHYYGGIDYGGHRPHSRWCNGQTEALSLVGLARDLLEASEAPE